MDSPLDATDTTLLTQLSTADDGAAPSTIATDHDWDLEAVLARLETLSERGLVRAATGGRYVLTDEGRAALRGEGDAGWPTEELPEWAARRPSWMQTADVAILDSLADRDEPIPAGDLAAGLEHPVEHVVDRCEELAAQGLVQPVDGQRYQLRELGLAFVGGDLDPVFLESE